MSWWQTALYDTCSVITLDKLLLDQAGLAGQFPSSILALDESFTADQLYTDTASRMKPHFTICPLPTTAELAAVLASANLSKAIAAVDTLIYATAIHRNLAVVTGDKRLARAIKANGNQVGNMALILRELVLAKTVSEGECEAMLLALAARKDIIVGGLPAPSWNDLQNYTFPD
jgi:predicted nucleic acid-binding protein